jgi:hypothetical protein
MILFSVTSLLLFSGKCTDDGVSFSQAVGNSEAIAVSNGSLKMTTVWTLEPSDGRDKISGYAITPGVELDLSSYRSELTGLLTIMVMIHHRCKFYDIKEGRVEGEYDGKSALCNAFLQLEPRIDESNFDILSTIHFYWKITPVLWDIRHIRGHQDRHTSTLDRWET